MTRTLEEVLQSVSDVLFPADIGDAPVELDSRSADGDTPLHVMNWRRDYDGARLLIEAGADVNALGDMDETPLHVAVANQDPVLVRLLLDHGARDDLVSEFGKTARQAAQQRGGPVWETFAEARRGKKQP